MVILRLEEQGTLETIVQRHEDGKLGTKAYTGTDDSGFYGVTAIPKGDTGPLPLPF